MVQMKTSVLAVIVTGEKKMKCRWRSSNHPSNPHPPQSLFSTDTWWVDIAECAYTTHLIGILLIVNLIGPKFKCVLMLTKQFGATPLMLYVWHLSTRFREVHIDKKLELQQIEPDMSELSSRFLFLRIWPPTMLVLDGVDQHGISAALHASAHRKFISSSCLLRASIVRDLFISCSYACGYALCLGANNGRVWFLVGGVGGGGCYTLYSYKITGSKFENNSLRQSCPLYLYLQNG